MSIILAHPRSPVKFDPQPDPRDPSVLVRDDRCVCGYLTGEHTTPDNRWLGCEGLKKLKAIEAKADARRERIDAIASFLALIDWQDTQGKDIPLPLSRPMLEHYRQYAEMAAGMLSPKVRDEARRRVDAVAVGTWGRVRYEVAQAADGERSERIQQYAWELRAVYLTALRGEMHPAYAQLQVSEPEEPEPGWIEDANDRLYAAEQEDSDEIEEGQ